MTGKFRGKKVLVTAGPTYEAIDPVRFIGNYSSGKMGFALAETLSGYGAEVILVTGPTSITTDEEHIAIERVVSSEEMYKAVLKHNNEVDAFFLAAAVADFKPKFVAAEKIKKNKEGLTIELEKTTDIAKELAKVRSEKQVVVGFALETENEIENASRKLNEKKFDMIVLNSLKDEGAGFVHNTNKVTIIEKDNKINYFELKDKAAVARDIVELAAKYL